MDNRTHLLEQLKSSQRQLVKLLESVAGYQDWQPDADSWSFRDVAAHMAATEQECYRERVHRIAAGETPQFDYYFNTGRDFSQFDLRDSLRAWQATRREIIEFVRVLPEEKLLLTGTHVTFGVITVLDVLRLMLDHDREHVQDLEQTIASFKAKGAASGAGGVGGICVNLRVGVEGWQRFYPLQTSPC